MARIFFAYPYQFDKDEPHYRVALREACADQKHEAVFANAVPAEHDILQHVHECIAECDAAYDSLTVANDGSIALYQPQIGAVRHNRLLEQFVVALIARLGFCLTCLG